MPDYKAILSGQSWNALPTLGSTKKPVFLTYTFNPPPLDSLWDWSRFGSADREVARKALQMWGDASGIRFIEVKGQEAELKFQWQETWSSTIAWAEFPALNRDRFGNPGDRIRDPAGGNVYLNSLNRSEIGENPHYKLYVLLHEIGHALGLKHPFHKMDHNKQLLASDLDKVEYTVMSYTGGDPEMGPVSLGPLDIQAIRALYGDPSQDGRQVSKWHWNQSKQILSQTGKSKADTIYGVAVKDVIKGDAGNDRLHGFGGDDILYGGTGRDVLSGGDGNDRFTFDTWLKAGTNVDRILDFGNEVDTDKIVLSSKIFGTIAKGQLSDAMFVDGAAAADSDDRILFDNDGERAAYYDPDGSGPVAAVCFVKIPGTVTIGASDFFVI